VIDREIAVTAGVLYEALVKALHGKDGVCKTGRCAVRVQAMMDAMEQRKQEKANG